jgi:uncharacterized protein (DUF433 family)
MSFEVIRREYDIADEDIRAALRFVSEQGAQRSFHTPPST